MVEGIVWAKGEKTNCQLYEIETITFKLSSVTNGKEIAVRSTVNAKGGYP